MMNREGLCEKERLVSTASSVILRCRCGIYHVRINRTTLHLTESQFNATARLFKFALHRRIMYGASIRKKVEGIIKPSCIRNLHV